MGSPVERRPRVAVLTNTLPPYRAGFYRKLAEQLDVVVFCEASSSYGAFPETSGKLQIEICHLRVLRMLKGQAVLHAVPIRRLLGREFDLLVSDGNLRHPVYTFVATIRRLLNRPVAIWSSLSHPNRSLRSKLRSATWRPIRHFLLYTDHDVDLLRAEGFDPTVVMSIDNALDLEEIESAKAYWTDDKLLAWRQSQGFVSRQLIITSGRLQENRVADLVEVLPRLVAAHSRLLWVIIGDGPGKALVQDRLAELNMLEHVNFVGAVFDEHRIAPYFLSSELFVYPHAIGLSMMHAFSYGLPVVTHDNYLDHGPEFVALTQSGAGSTYRYGDRDSLFHEVDNLLRDERTRQEMRQKALGIVRDKYNINAMVSNFVNFVHKVLALS